MKNRTQLSAFLVLFAVLVACSVAPSAEDMHATAQNIANTSIALTVAAIPTETALPSDTATLVPSATYTQAPSALPTGTATVAPITPTTPLPTATNYGQMSGSAQETAWADKEDKNAPLMLRNNSGLEIHLILLSPVYQEYTFTSNMSLILPENTYSYRVFIGDKAFSGSFSITNGDKHALVFFEDHVRFGVP
jgi:hypothetical protein